MKPLATGPSSARTAAGDVDAVKLDAVSAGRGRYFLLMAQVVRDPDGQAWTVSMVRGNQWQTWAYIRFLDRLSDADGSGSGIGLLLMALQFPGAVAALVRVASYKVRGRHDVRVTVRRGKHGDGNARLRSTLDDLVDSDDLALLRVDSLVRQIRHEGVSTS